MTVTKPSGSQNRRTGFFSSCPTKVMVSSMRIVETPAPTADSVNATSTASMTTNRPAVRKE